MRNLLTNSILLLFLLFYAADVFGFEKQIGQIKDQNGIVNEHVFFKTYASGMLVLLTKNGFSYQLTKENSLKNNGIKQLNSDLDTASFDFNRVDVELVNLNKNFTIETYDKLEDKKYFYLNKSSEKLKSIIYKRVVFKNIYENIDLEFTDYDGVFKYNFIVRPGGNLQDIQLEYKTNAEVAVKNQEVLINTSIQKIRDYIPASFIDNKSRTEVDVVYHKNDDRIGYKLLNTELNATDTLIIDPMPHRFFGTYSGGGSDEYVNEITIDEEGNTYITGYTNSLNNIATTGTYQGTLNAVFDVFIAKYTPQGSKVWGTYVGGGSFDRAFGIDYNNGSLYVVGSTYSPNYATAGAHQETSIDDDDAFVAKFDTTGNRIWSTYYGGDLHDFAAAVITDTDENIYITGHSSSNFNIASVGSHLETHNGNTAAFLAKFNTNGQFLWGTYYGNSFEEGWGITLDSNEDPIFSGFTSSTSGIATSGAHQSNNGGAMDAFLVKFNQSGTLQWGTYYGGANDDFGYEIDCDSADNIYFVGGTSSANNIFYNSGFQSTPTSIDEGFVAKFDANGVNIWGTYIGGNEADYLYGVKNYLDAGVLITGLTQSAENIATSGAFSTTLAGQYDALIMKLSPTGDLDWGSYYGGPLSDEGRGIAINPANAYFTIAGYSMSSSGVTSSGADQETYGGGIYDGFLTKFCAPIIPTLNYSFSGNLCSDDDELLTIDSLNYFNSIEWSDGTTLDTIDLTALPVGSYSYYITSLDTNNCPSYSDTLTFNKYQSTPLNINQNQNSYCAGDDLVLWSDDIFNSYLWSTGINDTLIEYQNTIPGSSVYSLEAINSDGCSSYDTVEITINPNPIASLNVQGSANFCLNETVDVGVSGSYDQYNWYDGETTSFITLQEEDSVWVYVENQFGCGSYSDTLFINSELLTPEVVLLSDLPLCEDSLIAFGVNNSYDEYEWMNGEEDATVNLNLGEGTHYVYVNVSNQCGGEGITDSLEVVIPPTTQADINFIGPDSLCINEQYDFYLDGVFDNVIWQNDLIADSLAFSTSTPGAYTFVVETVDTNGCPSFDTLVLTFEACDLGVSEFDLEQSWSFFPNPTSDKVYINTYIDRPLNFSIISTKGELIEKKTIEDGGFIDFSDFSNGVYILVPNDPKKRFLPKRIIVQ